MLTKYQHPDGGTYVIVNDHCVSMKTDNGSWVPAVVHQRVVRGPNGQWMYEGKNQFVVSKQHWAERFTAMSDTDV